ncbi:MAG: antibiotic biosynthesis monooxygenase family protein [Acidimicrobiales bacterium]|jgi:heme-degrading monooxygenase HmoA
MIVEHVMLSVTPGREEEFERSIVRAFPVIESAPECHGAEVRRQVEDGSNYLLLIRWSTVEAHMAFRASPLFDEWRQLTHVFYAQPPTVTHYREPLER